MITKLTCGGDGYIVDEEGYYYVYVADNADDLTDLPTGLGMAFGKNKPRPGSLAIVASTRDVYMLSNSREWNLYLDGSNL